MSVRGVVFAAACLAAASADASEISRLHVPGGIAALERAGGIAGGLSQPAAPVVVVRADGRRFALSRSAGALVLIPAQSAARPPAAPDMLPDGEITRGSGNIRRAWLIGPTERYRHGVLGDRIEASGVAVERSDGRRLEFRLGGDSVFEDRRARLFDLDGDAADEVVVVRSYLDAGAALAVLEVAGDSLRVAAEVAPIGSPRRWLNPAGAGDFDGDGRAEIAYVETPHIGGTLKLYEYRGGRLVADGAARGFANHALGRREQDQAAVIDWNGDGVVDLLVPDVRQRALRIVTFAGETFREIERIDHPARIATAILPAVVDRGGVLAVVYGLADGTLVAVSPSPRR